MEAGQREKMRKRGRERRSGVGEEEKLRNQEGSDKLGHQDSFRFGFQEAVMTQMFPNLISSSELIRKYLWHFYIHDIRAHAEAIFQPLYPFVFLQAPRKSGVRPHDASALLVKCKHYINREM